MNWKYVSGLDKLYCCMNSKWMTTYVSNLKPLKGPFYLPPLLPRFQIQGRLSNLFSSGQLLKRENFEQQAGKFRNGVSCYITTWSFFLSVVLVRIGVSRLSDSSSFFFRRPNFQLCRCVLLFRCVQAVIHHNYYNTASCLLLSSVVHKVCSSTT